jgi:hypothetical protein
VVAYKLLIGAVGLAVLIRITVVSIGAKMFCIGAEMSQNI